MLDYILPWVGCSENGVVEYQMNDMVDRTEIDFNKKSYEFLSHLQETTTTRRFSFKGERNCDKINNNILWYAGCEYNMFYRWINKELSFEKGKLLILTGRVSHEICNFQFLGMKKA
ncbi:MAG: hypothetical protein QXF12_01510 [Candidatus Aenigmatarchaeota archaeon]